MALQERTRSYEILIRFSEDGSVGAHSQSITEITRDGEVISAVIDSPVPLTIDELKARVADLVEPAPTEQEPA